MSSTVVSGFVLPVSVAGHPALDFCNTVAGWGSETPKDYLRSYAHLAVWAGVQGLVRSRAVPALRRSAAEPSGQNQSEQLLTEAQDLRSAAYAVLLGSRRRDLVGTVGAAAARARFAATLRLQPPGATGGDLRATWRLDTLGLDLPLLAIAASVDEALTAPLPGRVRACPGDGCGWLFLDVTGRRRWCDMAVCGNRAKARRHAARRSGRPRPTR